MNDAMDSVLKAYAVDVYKKKKKNLGKTTCI